RVTPAVVHAQPRRGPQLAEVVHGADLVDQHERPLVAGDQAAALTWTERPDEGAHVLVGNHPAGVIEGTDPAGETVAHPQARTRPPHRPLTVAGDHVAELFGLHRASLLHEPAAPG